MTEEQESELGTARELNGSLTGQLNGLKLRAGWVIEKEPEWLAATTVVVKLQLVVELMISQPRQYCHYMS